MHYGIIMCMLKYAAYVCVINHDYSLSVEGGCEPSTDSL